MEGGRWRDLSELELAMASWGLVDSSGEAVPDRAPHASRGSSHGMAYRVLLRGTASWMYKPSHKACFAGSPRRSWGSAVHWLLGEHGLARGARAWQPRGRDAEGVFDATRRLLKNALLDPFLAPDTCVSRWASGKGSRMGLTCRCCGRGKGHAADTWGKGW